MTIIIICNVIFIFVNVIDNLYTTQVYLAHSHNVKGFYAS